MSRLLLVPDLALEGWRSMDRYAAALAQRVAGLTVPPEAARIHGPRYLARYVRYPRALRRYRPAVVHIADHSYAHCLASFRSSRSVITLHDLWPAHVLAGHTGGLRGAVRDALLRRVLDWVRRADWWIAGSRFTAGEAVRLLGLPGDRVTVVPYGVDEQFSVRPPQADLERRRDAWARDCGTRADRAHVILHVGTCEPRKDVETALRTVGRLRARGLDAILVQIGGRFSAAQRHVADAEGVAASTIQEPNVDERALREAYHAADLLLLPSAFEGFGLPALEAAAAGLPVVTSGAGGLAEAAGPAAPTAPIGDADGFAEAVALVLADPVARAAIVAGGRAHAARHTWDDTARRTAEIYGRLTSSH